MKQKLVYIGTSSVGIQKIIESNLFDFTKAICEKKRVSDEYLNRIDKNNLQLYTFETKEEFVNIIQQYKRNEYIFLIYQLDFIIPSVLTNAYLFFNLHAGDINTNRGAHPIIWSILNNDKTTDFTLHQINEKIDQGVLVTKYSINIEITDGVDEIKTKMEMGFNLILNQLDCFIKGDLHGTIIQGGIYRKPICEHHYTIDLNDSKEIIENKIRSQKSYRGAVLYFENNKYFVDKLIEYNLKSNKRIGYKLENKLITLNLPNITYVFQINL